MDRYLELNTDGVVVNIIIWDGVSPYEPNGMTVLPYDEHPNATFGWRYDGINWIVPEEITDGN